MSSLSRNAVFQTRKGSAELHLSLSAARNRTLSPVRPGAGLLRVTQQTRSRSAPATFLSHLASGWIHILLLKTRSNNATASVFGACYCPRECSYSPADEVTCSQSLWKGFKKENPTPMTTAFVSWGFFQCLTQPKSSSPNMTCKKGSRCKPHSRVLFPP